MAEEKEVLEKTEDRIIRRWKMAGATFGIALGIAGGAYFGDGIYQYVSGRLASDSAEYRNLPPRIHNGVRIATDIAFSIPAAGIGAYIGGLVFSIPGGIAALAMTRRTKD